MSAALSPRAAWPAWATLWLGWLVMGQLGSAMAWSWFSGLLGVVAWWSWMQWAPAGWHPRRTAARGAWLLLALLGMAGVMLAGRHQLLGWLGWAAAIAGWAQTSLGLATLGRPCPAPTPVWWREGVLGLATAWLVAGVAADPLQWRLHWPLAGLLLLALAGPSLRSRATPVPGQRPPVTPAAAQVATLLMMGTLPLMSQWCVSNGQPVVWAAGLHLWAMAWASWGTHLLLQHSPRLPRRTRFGLAQLFLCQAALVAWLGADLLHMVLTMALLSAATALLTWAPALPSAPRVPAGPGLAWLAGAAGPAALLWLGHAAPTLGPQTLPLALSALALWALLQPLVHAWLVPSRWTGAPTLSSPPSGTP